MRTSRMQRFWDRRATENPWYFINNLLDYRDPDQEEFWRSGERDLDRLLGQFDRSLEPDDVVVDIGCGMGRLTRAIAARVDRAVGIDVSPRMVTLAEEHNADLDNVTWMVGDGVSLGGLDDASADVCVSHVTFQHIPDASVTLGYIREIARVLRPGGWAVVQVSNDPTVHERRGLVAGLRDRIEALLGRRPGGQSDACWLGAAVDLDELAGAAEAAGGRVAGVTGAGTQFCIVHLTRPDRTGDTAATTADHAADPAS